MKRAPISVAISGDARREGLGLRQESPVWRILWRSRWGLASAVLVLIFIVGGSWLRNFNYRPDPGFLGYLEIVSGLIVFTIAANALVRFQGTQDRLSLLFATGFVLTGLMEISSSMLFFSLQTDSLPRFPTPWMLGRTLLALVFLCGLFVERRMPSSREPGREIVIAFLAAAVVLYVASAFYLGTPVELTVRTGNLIPRPWQLLPALMFAAASWGYRRRLRQEAAPFEWSLCVSSALNALCHLAASQSEFVIDAPFELAQVLKVSSYALVLGGALLDNARLFDQVRNMAVNDPLTGLANYRRFAETLEAELKRSSRTGRSFAVILLDLDGLKKINDRLGHLVGTRAIERIAVVLRQHCRSMDTAARYGGDEFAMILPETDEMAARSVAMRIEARLAADSEDPRLSASLGVAVYPQDGDSTKVLLELADQELYKRKAQGKKKRGLPRIAAAV